ncbi:adenosylhomocysteinase [Elysia marginata]|uniref:Adenosylhomocysteinase n=1 Tax=Elysia marginata TaxID=1093978 RepID=A0AAV4K0P0_9GAST|nr:adenosylhomocysteinase [Elysia marginata]
MASTKGPEPAPVAGSSSSSHLGPMLSRSRRPSAFVTDCDVQAIKEIKYNLTSNRPRIRSRSVSQSSTDSYSSGQSGLCRTGIAALDTIRAI